MEVDIISGKPKEEVQKEQQKERDSLIISEGGAVEGALRSRGGKKLLDIIEEQLEQRIRELISKDEQCIALMKILDNIGQKIDRAKGISVKLMRRLKAA